MITIPVKIIDTSKNIKLPVYESENAAGMDIRASTDEDITIFPSSYKLIHSGFALAIPVGYEAQIRPKSGLALKHGLFVLNSPGTIDSDYRGEICIIIANFSNSDFIVSNGDRVAQLVICPVIQANLSLKKDLSSTKRGTGGFGSTNSKL